jgi:hypothetical protein
MLAVSSSLRLDVSDDAQIGRQRCGGEILVRQSRGPRIAVVQSADSRKRWRDAPANALAGAQAALAGGHGRSVDEPAIVRDDVGDVRLVRRNSRS